MHRDARALAGRVQAGHDGRVVAEHLGVVVRRDAAHRIVRGRQHRHGLGVRLDAEVGARELGDVGQLRVDHRGLEVRDVEVDVVLVGAGAATLADLGRHAARDDVPRSEVLDRRRVALHESLALAVAQDRALTAGGFREQDAEPGQSRRVELEELHVLEREPLAPDDPDAVAGEGVRVGGRLVDLAEPAGGEDDRLALEHVQLAGRQLVRDDAGGLAVGHHEVEHVELVEEVDAVLDAVLVQGLQDHVAGAVRGIARAAHRGLAVVRGVAAEPALVDLAVRRAVEREAHVLEVDDGVDRLLGEDLRGILIDQVVTALDGVEGVPLPVVLLDVREGCGHAALRRAGVGASGVELGDHGGAGVRSGLDGRAHPGAAGAHDHDVELVVVHAVDQLGRGDGGHARGHGFLPRHGYGTGQKLGSSSAAVPAGQGSNV